MQVEIRISAADGVVIYSLGDCVAYVHLSITDDISKCPAGTPGDFPTHPAQIEKLALNSIA